MDKSLLWSIKDYQNLAYTNPSSYKELLKEKLIDMELDPYNAFISSLDPVSLEKSSKQIGVPIALKDNICYSGFPTTCASKMLHNWIPDFDASIIKHLDNSGFSIIGKTNLDEFAMGNTTESSYFGKSYNPWNPYKQYSPGGSSGGSAIAVATGYTPVAIGSDTGGSVRCPASFCGVVGLKPTYGRVSRYGLISYAHTLDQIGIFSRYAEDIGKTLEIISKSDPKDMTHAKKEYEDKMGEITESISIGIDPHVIEQVPEKQQLLIMNALKLLEQKSIIRIKEIKLDQLDILLPTYYVIAFSEAYSNLVRYSGRHYGFDAGSVIDTRLEGFGNEVKRRFDLGSFSLKTGFSEQLYKKSVEIRSYFTEKFKYLLKDVQILALPTMLDTAFRFGNNQTPIDSYKADLLTVPANLTGVPAISIPVGFTKKDNSSFPVGVQLLSSWWQEDILIKIAMEYQKITKHHLKLPPDPIKQEEQQ